MALDYWCLSVRGRSGSASRRVGELIEKILQLAIDAWFQQASGRRHLSRMSRILMRILQGGVPRPVGYKSSKRMLLDSSDVSFKVQGLRARIDAYPPCSLLGRIGLSECLTEAERFESLRQQEVYQALLDAYTEWMQGSPSMPRRQERLRFAVIRLRRFFLWLGPEATAQGLSRIEARGSGAFLSALCPKIGESRA